MEKKSLKRQSKGNSAINGDIQIKLHVHNLTIIIYIQYKFHDIGYLVMAEDGKNIENKAIKGP